MGEKQNGPFQLSFNASIKVDSKDHESLRTTREEHATSAGGAPAPLRLQPHRGL